MKGSLIILMTVIITITCDYQRAIGRSENIQSRGPVGRRSDPGNARVQPEEGSNSLLMGKLIGQGAIRSEVVGSARQQGVGPSEIEEVKGREVAESARQHVDPQDELEIGRQIKEYQQNPQDAQVRMDVGGSGRMMSGPIPRAHGTVLDEDVQTGRAVPNPIKVLGEIKARGGDIETVKGEVVAGNAVDIDVVSIKESEIQSRNECGVRCLPGTFCCPITKSCESDCPYGRQRCSDGQIYCIYLSKCTLPQECRI